MNRLRFVPLLAALSLACSDEDPFTPTADNVVGTYTATTFTATDNSGTFDLLAQGATLAITLAGNGTTTGHVFVPGALDADLTGTWTLTGGVVVFDHAADTFVRDMAFIPSRDALDARRTFSTATIHVLLRK